MPSAASVSTASTVSAFTSSWPQRAALITWGLSLYFVSTWSESSGWLPSCSWVSALPMSCSSPMRLASLTSAPISAAIMPASQETSLECCRQFWPYDVRNFSRPTSFTSSGCRPCTPTSKQAFSPSSLRCTSISCLTLLTTSSIRAGWMRQPRDLAAVRIVGGDQNGLGRVVHDEVDPGVLLERADVATLAADDAALHVVGGQVDHRHRGLHRVVRGE